MTRTTVYLPEELKGALVREARRRGCSEAEVIRQAIAAAVQAPCPNVGFLDEEPLADHADELLAGCGVPVQ